MSDYVRDEYEEQERNMENEAAALMERWHEANADCNCGARPQDPIHRRWCRCVSNQEGRPE